MIILISKCDHSVDVDLVMYQLVLFGVDKL